MQKTKTGWMAFDDTWTTEDGQLTFWVRAFRTVGEDLYAGYLAQLIPRDHWGLMHITFIVLESAVSWIDFEGELSAERKALMQYRDIRETNFNGENTASNWNLFTSTIGQETFKEIWTAYAAIRPDPAAQPPKIDLASLPTKTRKPRRLKAEPKG